MGVLGESSALYFQLMHGELMTKQYRTDHMPSTETVFTTHRAEEPASGLTAARLDEQLMMKTFRHWTSSGFLRE